MLIWLVKSTTVVFIRSPATQSVVFIPVSSGLHQREISMTNFSINIQRTRPWLWYRTFGVINCVYANSDDLNMATSHINQWGKSRYFSRSPSRMKTTAVVYGGGGGGGVFGGLCIPLLISLTFRDNIATKDCKIGLVSWSSFKCLFMLRYSDTL